MDTNYYKKYEPFFNSWYIKRQIGEGSFGKVYEIEREDFGRTYKAALKVITIPQNKSEVKSAMAEGMDEQSTRSYFRGLVEELINEFDIMSKVKGNTNIVSYEDHAVFEHTDGIGWDIVIRMELLTPLLDYVRENPFTEKDVIKMGCDICSALEVCRRHNIIHRDIKPENIFVSEDGNFKLGDFGISRTVERTTSGLSKKGTYTYMAPEVYKGQPYNASVDIYSLGIVLYRFLNQNRTPFMPEYPTPITYTDREIALEKRIKGETMPAIKNITPGLSNVVLKACSYNPDNRYATPEEFKQALSGISSTTANYQYNPVNTSADRTEAFFTQTDARTQGMFAETTAGFDKTEAFYEGTSAVEMLSCAETKLSTTKRKENEQKEKMKSADIIRIVLLLCLFPTTIYFERLFCIAFGILEIFSLFKWKPMKKFFSSAKIIVGVLGLITMQYNLAGSIFSIIYKAYRVHFFEFYFYDLLKVVCFMWGIFSESKKIYMSKEIDENENIKSVPCANEWKIKLIPIVLQCIFCVIYSCLYGMEALDTFLILGGSYLLIFYVIDIMSLKERYLYFFKMSIGIVFGVIACMIFVRDWDYLIHNNFSIYALRNWDAYHSDASIHALIDCVYIYMINIPYVIWRVFKDMREIKNVRKS